jgi:hypothetical protein
LLTTASLMQGKMPNKGGVGSMDMDAMVTGWPRIERALVRAANFLARQHIYDDARLPSAPVVAVIAACFDKIPEEGDALGRAEQLLRAYMWSCFFTTRYEGPLPPGRSPTTRALLGVARANSSDPPTTPHVPLLRARRVPAAYAGATDSRRAGQRGPTGSHGRSSL